jgi:curli biogenesis system outer membrane secretion channel CsgG
MSAWLRSLLVLLSVNGWAASPDSTAQTADRKPVLAILKFQDETGGMAMMGGVGRALTNEVANRATFTVVERRKLNEVMQEQNLAASARVDAASGAKIGLLVGADYLITGTVTAFEEKIQTDVRSSMFSGTKVRTTSSGGYMAVDLRVIDSQTGAIAFVRTIEAHTAGGSATYDIDDDRAFAGAGLQAGPDAKAVRGAVIEIVDYFECVMVKRDTCVDEFATRDAERMTKTRRSVDLHSQR